MYKIEIQIAGETLGADSTLTAQIPSDTVNTVQSATLPGADTM